MAIYEPAQPELGKNARGRRVSALRKMNEAGGTQFKRYTGGGKVSYRVVNKNGIVREITTGEVAPYVIAHADCYDGVRPQILEALRDALVDPEVTDQQTLLRVVMDNLDERCGEPLHAAAEFFASSDTEGVSAIA